VCAGTRARPWAQRAVETPRFFLLSDQYDCQGGPKCKGRERERSEEREREGKRERERERQIEGGTEKEGDRAERRACVCALVVIAPTLLVCRLTSFRPRGAPRDAASFTLPWANPTYTLDSAPLGRTSMKRLILHEAAKKAEERREATW